MEYISPLSMLYKWEKEKADDIFLSQPIDSISHSWTWGQVAIESRKMAAYLLSLDLPKRSKIGILSKNCAHWIMSDFAIMMARAYISCCSVKKAGHHSKTKLPLSKSN